jgi:glutathione S-transferase
LLKIYGAAHSRAFRVIWLANEINLPYQHIPVTFGIPDAQCKEPWFLALNPNGRLPVIDDDGFVMWESAAINLYLVEKYKGSLYPSSPQERGRMLQWTFFVSNHVEPPLITLFRNRVFYPPEQRNASVADKAEDELRGSLQILEQELGRNQFFAGADWGMSDFMVACVLYVLTRLNLDLTAYPKLEAWLLASINRPAARSARKLREGDHSAFGGKADTAYCSANVCL